MMVVSLISKFGKIPHEKNFFSIALFLISMSYKLSFFRSYSLNCSVWANYALKGKYTEKIVSHFLLQSDRPSKMMNICKKKSRSKFQLFRELLRFEFSILDKRDVILVHFYDRSTFIYWKLEKGRPHNFLNNWVGSIKFYISNIFCTRNPKIVFIFEIDDAFLNYSWMWITQ